MLPIKQGKKVVVHKEDEGAIHLANNHLESAQLKRIDRNYHLVGNEVSEGRLAITRTSS